MHASVADVKWNVPYVYYLYAFNTHGRPKQLSSMEHFVDYSCRQ